MRGGKQLKKEERLKKPSETANPPSRNASKLKKKGWKSKSPILKKNRWIISDRKKTSASAWDITATGWKP